MATSGLIRFCIRFCTYCLIEILKHRVNVEQGPRVLFERHRGLTSTVLMGKVHCVLRALTPWLPNPTSGSQGQGETSVHTTKSSGINLNTQARTSMMYGGVGRINTYSQF